MATLSIYIVLRCVAFEKESYYGIVGVKEDDECNKEGRKVFILYSSSIQLDEKDMKRYTHSKRERDNLREQNVKKRYRSFWLVSHLELK
jgi:hypothetical protein